MTDAEWELLDHVLSTEWRGGLLERLVAKVRDERRPKPRYEATLGIDKHHTEAGIWDNAEGRRLLRTEVAERLNDSG